MTERTFTINDPPGTFIVHGADGHVAFDSRLPLQRVHLNGTAVVNGPPDTSTYFGTLFVPYGMTFAKPPYVLSAARLLDDIGLYSQEFYSPRFTYSLNPVTGQVLIGGTYTAANETGVYLGNAGYSPPTLKGRAKFIYSVFGNTIG